MNLAHGQGDSLLGFSPREHAHFGLGREQRALHGDGVRMRGGSRPAAPGLGFWQLRTKSRVTVKTKSGLVSTLFGSARNIAPGQSQHRRLPVQG